MQNSSDSAEISSTMTALMEWKKFSDDLGYVGTPHDPGPSLARRKLRMTAGPPVKASTVWPNFHGLFGAASLP